MLTNKKSLNYWATAKFAAIRVFRLTGEAVELCEDELCWDLTELVSRGGSAREKMSSSRSCLMLHAARSLFSSMSADDDDDSSWERSWSRELWATWFLSWAWCLFLPLPLGDFFLVAGDLEVLLMGDAWLIDAPMFPLTTWKNTNNFTVDITTAHLWLNDLATDVQSSQFNKWPNNKTWLLNLY